MNPAIAKQFLLTTDYPLDKVIFLSSGNATVPTPSAGFKITIPHGLPFVPLVSGSWSLSSDFSTTYEYQTGNFPSPNPGAIFSTVLDVGADATNVYVNCLNTSGATVPIWYRVFGFEPANVNFNIPSTASTADQFVLNTDYNYTKLYLSDNFLPVGTGGSTVNVTHGLGYLPQVMVWFENSLGIIAPLDISDVNLTSNFISAVVTTTQVQFVIPSGTYPKVHYRIYLDDNA